MRFRLDVPGRFERVHKSVKICPTAGPGFLTKSVRERRAAEIVNSFGANSEEHFNAVMAIETGATFAEQFRKWIAKCSVRRRMPVKPATIKGWQSYFSKWLNPLIGSVPLANVNNSILREVIAQLSAASLSPKTIRNITQVITKVVASAVNDDGGEIFPRKWNYDFVDLPIVGKQRTPMFSGEEVTRIIQHAGAQERVVYMLFAATGLRAGELFGLEVRHFKGRTISVDQSVWEGRVQAPKTVNARRHVDLYPDVAKALSDFIGDRQEGFIFRARTGAPYRQSNYLRSFLHPILDELGIERQGFHSFRRFRVTHLESSSVPTALVKYWTGHASSIHGGVVHSTVTDRYVQMEKDERFRAEVAERIGLGFRLPVDEIHKVVPDVPNFQEMEATVSR